MNSKIITHNLAPILQNPLVQRMVSDFDLEIEEATIHNVKVPQDKLPLSVSEDKGNGVKKTLFSFFKKPISNPYPYKDIGILEAHKAITGNYFKPQTQIARQLFLEYLDTRDKKPYTDFKTTNFGYCTFSGTFSKRADGKLLQHSGLYCMDSDNVLRARDLMNRITQLEDPYFEVELCFRSMSGFGVKWVISLKTPIKEQIHKKIYEGIQGYFEEKYEIKTDNTPEVSRACFLSHDPNAYIHPKYRF